VGGGRGTGPALGAPWRCDLVTVAVAVAVAVAAAAAVTLHVTVPVTVPELVTVTELVSWMQLCREGRT